MCWNSSHVSSIHKICKVCFDMICYDFYLFILKDPLGDINRPINCFISEKQVFYLVDEAELPGKGANTVTSMAHHYFLHHGLGETDAVINFDNCSGQNKNNVVLWYGLWRVLTGITYFP